MKDTLSLTKRVNPVIPLFLVVPNVPTLQIALIVLILTILISSLHAAENVGLDAKLATLYCV